jgi:4-hydroxy-3-polyprenylbenzoate decarboxylase
MASRLIIGMTGATGAVYGVRLLELLRETEIEAHLVMSRWALQTLTQETDYTREQVESLADVVYNANDQGAAIASGSFLTDGMIIAPCSMRSLGAIAHGVGDHLVHRAADVVIKEKRRLLLSVREAPLSEVHLKNMLRLARMGVVISPPLPAFYTRPTSIDEMVTQTCCRMLDQFAIHLGDAQRWKQT